MDERAGPVREIMYFNEAIFRLPGWKFFDMNTNKRAGSVTRWKFKRRRWELYSYLWQLPHIIKIMTL